MSETGSPEVVLQASRLSVAYGPHTILRDVNLVVRRGEFVAISGPNGGGKTTLIKASLGLLKPKTGSIEVLGQPAGSPDVLRRVGYVPQRLDISRDFPGTVSEVVRSGVWPQVGLVGRLPRSLEESISRAVDACGLSSSMRRRVGQLSGGMQQRVLLARALAGSPVILLLDEPMAGVDLPSQLEFREILRRLAHEEAMTVLVVVHEYGPFEGLVSRLVLLAEKVLYDGPPPKHEGSDHEHHSFPTTYLSLLRESGTADL
jgi:zinc transport system ATP-binding protein